MVPSLPFHILDNCLGSSPFKYLTKSAQPLDGGSSSFAVCEKKLVKTRDLPFFTLAGRKKTKESSGCKQSREYERSPVCGVRQRCSRASPKVLRLNNK